MTMYDDFVKEEIQDWFGSREHHWYIKGAKEGLVLGIQFGVMLGVIIGLTIFQLCS